MATYTIRPSAWLSGGTYAAWSSVASNSAFASAIGDNSDATYASRTGYSNVGQTLPIFSLAAPSIAANEFVCRIGHSIRWSGGGGTAAEYVGSKTFRSSDTTPTTTQTITTDGTASATSTEVGYSVVSWSVADCQSLRLAVYSVRNNPTSPTSYLYEAFSTIYTLALPTVSVSNQTFTTTPRPTIAVTGTFTYGWEASVADNSNLKRAVTQVRVESGGTGVGTGTLVASASLDQFNASTGTINVPITTTISNGTYNLYTRITRYRENQTTDQAVASTDQSSAWASATLTMNNPVPTSPTISPSVDATNKRIGVTITPVATNAVYGPSSVELQRSSDGGTTWTAIRTSPNSPRQNIIQNPNFETNTTGWSTSGSIGASLSRSIIYFQSGVASGAIQATTGSGNLTMNSQGGTTAATVTANSTYTASAYIRAGVTSKTGRVDIVWLNGAGTTISTSTGSATSLTSGSFVRVSTTATAPSNAAYAQVSITMATVNIGEVYYVDSVQLELGSSASTYLDFMDAVTLYDYEMPRGTSILYRARVNAYSVGYPTASAWATSTGYTLALTADWALKHLTNPTLNLNTVQIIDKPTEEIVEDIAVFRPLDRRYPVVVAGSLGGWDGQLTIVTTTSAEWSSLKALLEAQAVLYLESAFGWSKYIRITSGAKAEILGTQTAPRRRVEVSYVEVQAP